MRRTTVCWILLGLLAVPVPSFAFSLFHAPRFSLTQGSDDEAPLGELPGQQLERETGDAVFSYAGGNAMGDSTFLRGHFEFGLSLYTQPVDIEIIHLRFGGAQFDQDLNQGAEPYMSIGGRLRLYPSRKPFGPRRGIVPYGVGGGSFGFEWGTEDEFFGLDKQDYFGLWEVGGGIEFYGFDERRRTLNLSTCLFVEATTYWVQGGKPPANFLPESREWNQGVFLNIGLRGTPRVTNLMREEQERERHEKELPPEEREEKPIGPPGPPGHKDEPQEEKPPQSQDRPVEEAPSEPKEREFEWGGGDSSFHFTVGAFGQAPMDFDVPVAAFGGLSLGIGGEDVEFDVDIAFGDARRYASGIFVIGLRLRGYMGGSIENGEEVIQPYLVAGFWGVEGFNRYDFNGDAISDEIVSLGFDLGLGLEARDADSRSAFFLEILYTAVEEEFVYIDDPVNFAHTLGLRGGVRWRWP